MPSPSNHHHSADFRVDEFLLGFALKLFLDIQPEEPAKAAVNRKRGVEALENFRTQS